LFCLLLSTQGFVQFIESQPLRHVLERHRTIRQYLQSRITSNVNEDTTLNEIGLPPDVVDAYVKSCGQFHRFMSSY
jgi:hypothetical protein